MTHCSNTPRDGSLDKEMISRVSRAGQALGTPQNKELNQHIKLSTKLRVYLAGALAFLIYGCETCILCDPFAPLLAFDNRTELPT